MFICQGTAEGSPLLLCAWCGWRAEQPACPHHDAGAWFPSGPGHWPLTGAQEWGMFSINTTPLTEQFTPARCQRLWRSECRFMPEACQPVVLDKSIFFLYPFLWTDLWADPNPVPEGAVWVQIHADRSKLVQLLFWPTSSQGQPISDRLTFTLIIFSILMWDLLLGSSDCTAGLRSHTRFW